MYAVDSPTAPAQDPPGRPAPRSHGRRRRRTSTGAGYTPYVLALPALVLLAAPEAQRRFEHIGVDVAVGRMGPRLARAAHVVGAASVVAVAGILLWAGWEAVAFSRMVGLVTDVAEIPEWWVQLLLPVGAAVLLLVSLAQLIVLLMGGTPEYLPTGDEELPRDTLARGE